MGESKRQERGEREDILTIVEKLRESESGRSSREGSSS